MAYWEYELFIKKCGEVNEEEQKQQEEESGKYDVGSYSKSASSMMRNTQNSMNMPKMPSIKTPSF